MSALPAADPATPDVSRSWDSPRRIAIVRAVLALAWAAVSGAIQLGVAVHLRRTEGRQLPMIVSGALSTVAGFGFLASAGMDDAHLAGVGGYVALGAVLYLLWAHRSRTAPQAAR